MGTDDRCADILAAHCKLRRLLNTLVELRCEKRILACFNALAPLLWAHLDCEEAGPANLYGDAQTTARLWREHDDLRQRVERIMLHLARGADYAAISEDLEQFIAIFRRHEAEETDALSAALAI
ncbi:MAG: hemerythrin domain-containing protein [Deltaproteobacteria bacterium]|nr:hemerythrin domain-containing protein [Deltaproteobacteria bacterium]